MKHQPLIFFCFLVFFLSFIVASPQQFDSFSERVTFYPASLMVSHSPKPLTFYDNTKLLNIHTVLKFTDFGTHFSMSNDSCSEVKAKFFNDLLATVRNFQKVARRLLSLPGFQLKLKVTLTCLNIFGSNFWFLEPIEVQFLSVKLGHYVTVVEFRSMIFFAHPVHIPAVDSCG